jgi:spore coat polysaccharide biosynthesis protein SpsF
VTLRLYRHPEEYRLRAVVLEGAPDYSHHRWTLDTLDDYRFLSAVYNELGPNAAEASLYDVLGVLEKHPEFTALNAHIEQKAVMP